MGLFNIGTDIHALSENPAFALPAPVSFMGAPTITTSSVTSALEPILAPFKYTFLAGAGAGFLVGFISGIAFMKLKFILLIGLGLFIVVKAIL
jgi:hypothetical protein